jgi:uncharacterized phage-associated protein
MTEAQMAYSVLAVGNAFIELSKRDGVPVTNMKLQKLVYIAHGFALALHHEGLFREPVHAFQWGPVIPELYHAVKHFGRNAITEKIPVPAGELTIDLDDPNNIAAELVKMVWQKYGKYTAAQLSTLTHRDGTPWSQVWNDTEYGVIPNDLTRYHYKSLVKAA